MNLQARWQQLMQRASLAANTDTYDALSAAYTEKHRHYHTLTHIEHCLVLFDEYESLAERPTAIELAIWFHDAVYRPLKGNNEQKSAELAAGFLADNNVDAENVERVYAMIMATVHAAPASDSDTRLLVDIDLSILGCDESAYAQFEEAVRKEYRQVPGILYRRERRRILQSFLDRKYIYSHEQIRERLEAPARRNLESAIEMLA
ncbi:MAG: hypothetical protein QNJ00_07610 [Woeseiaceae bacterium]|nr:hypothetical protein [Woeseiaceae bacterium]